MKRSVAVAFVGLTIGFAVQTLAQKTDSVDPKIIEQIRALAVKFDETYNKSDPVALVAFYTEDGVFETPVGTYEGRQAVEERYAKYEFGIWHDDNLVETVDQVIVVGNDLRAVGGFSVIEHEAGNTIPFKGDFVWILVRVGDAWKIRRNTYNLT
jgi:ketosteroid isomerase-like protein